MQGHDDDQSQSKKTESDLEGRWRIIVSFLLYAPLMLHFLAVRNPSLKTSFSF